ncbi:hypothetical protein HYFRA_00003367 [Hymenoscyphus fraxineus]|uniref:WD40 repeat-like protein n=1 Tax=Hymenoscyphus fraxineus TaxID=746836 RepID=A0A9N9PT63_9HELO|nr:hypothetical protein HYFRA_00003367 [Hymenoscyphus fraxineus]
MASVLKRKRGSLEVQDATKRTKSVLEAAKNPIQNIGAAAGWDKGFGPRNTTTTSLVKTEKVNGAVEDGGRKSQSPEAIDFDLMNAGDFDPDAVVVNKPKPWALSESIGGRMLNHEPVFSADEKNLILASRTTLHVYSTATSLLTRSIKLNIVEPLPETRIVSFSLSPTTPNLVWAACSDGRIFKVDWTTGEGAEDSWRISSTGCIYMTVASMESAGRRRDIVFTTEIGKNDVWRVTANELTATEPMARTIYTCNSRINFIKTGYEGAVIAATSGNKIMLGNLRSANFGTVDKIRYEFRVFESADTICSLDLKVSKRPAAENPSHQLSRPIVDLVVGDVLGSIFVHDDLLANLHRLQDGKLPKGISITPRKLHWHRQAVHTVKWSLDGNYIISGGTETVLVIWQLDTGKQQFLPNMSATIQNVTISPSGSSYAIQLADNSSLVLSTAELLPTTNISGIQASVLADENAPGSEIKRVCEESWRKPLVQRTPAVISPISSSELFLAVGQTQEISRAKPLIIGSPFLQNFDLRSGHSSSRQALTRAHTTNKNTSPNAHRLSEPRVSHMKISYDGKWLATVDEWLPPARDLLHLGLSSDEAENERLKRREVFLKFWEYNETIASWELVSRIDAPHTVAPNSSSPGRILDLVADPESSRFATIGQDGVVCIWSTKARKRDGVLVKNPAGKALRNWRCQHAISVGKLELPEELGKVYEPVTSGSVAFSDDGSVLAAGCSGQAGVLNFLDSQTGIIRHSQTNLFEGEITSMEFLGQDLIILANRLSVYDLVSNDIRLQIRLSSRLVDLSVEQKQEMVHLAVHKKSRTFAVALPTSYSDKKEDKTSLKHTSSELFVFQQDNPEPELQESLPTLVTALLPAVDFDGYLALDSAAEVRTVYKKGTQVVTNLAQSTSALQLEEGVEEPAEVPVPEIEGVVDDDDSEMEIAIRTTTKNEDDDDDDNDTPVVTQQELSEIFDIGPAFALPPIEEMFYQVAGLFSSKPHLVQSVS